MSNASWVSVGTGVALAVGAGILLLVGDGRVVLVPVLGAAAYSLIVTPLAIRFGFVTAI